MSNVCVDFRFKYMFAAFLSLPDFCSISKGSCQEAKMTPPSPLLSLLLILALVSGNLASSLKVLDFSADNDGEPDSNGEFTSATLDAGFLPESFTVCSAVMVDAWTTMFTATRMFTLLAVDGKAWARIYLFAASGYTEYEVQIDRLKFVKQTEAVLFPLQWTRACLSLDSSKVRVVVNGQMLLEEEYRRGEDTRRPANFSLMLGSAGTNGNMELPVKISNLNVFNSSSSVERMVGLTRAGQEECGTPGNLVSWEEAEWTLHSQAKLIEVDREW